MARSSATDIWLAMPDSVWSATSLAIAGSTPARLC
jgi:hypothetical protein